MITAFDPLRQLSMASLLLRLVLAMVCGGLIGMERGKKRRAAGLRTYMLVCLGAALSVVLSQYFSVMLTTVWSADAALVGRTTDVSRIAAMVVGSIGFLGTGTIIITGKQEVRGLTTAAGLWASASLGIAIGAAMTTLTSEFLLLNMHYYLDISRIGASVVSGIGFIGAGTIIVTRHQRVKGLTTAAGLWTAAIVGLSFGGGFYEGGIAATLLILLAELVFSRWENLMLGRAPIINLYLEYRDKDCLETVLQEFKNRGVKVMNLEITRADEEKNHASCALFTLQLNKKTGADALLTHLRGMQGVVRADEL